MQLKLSTKTHLYFASISRIKLATTWTTGTSNHTEDGMYIPYLDYDFMEYQLIEDELKHLQNIFNLGNFYMLQSSEKKYHAICLSKLTAKEFIELLENSSCDAAFRKIPRFKSIRNWVLRCYSKDAKQEPKVISTLQHKTSRQESTAHFNILKILHKEINKIQHADNLTKVILTTYKTAER